MTSVGNFDITNHRPEKLNNLDVILAVGNCVKLRRGILFRRWDASEIYLKKQNSINDN